MPLNISAVMIVKNEIRNLPDCLRTIMGHVDELVIVDTGSADGTPYLIDSWAESANKGTKVVRGAYQWQDDFSAARNYAMTLATGDWIFTVDADDRVVVDDWPILKSLMEQNPPEFGQYDVISCRILNVFRDAGSSEGEIKGALQQERFFRRSAGMQYRGAWHNQPTWPGTMPGHLSTPFRILHVGYGMLTLDEQKDKQERLIRMGEKACAETPERTFVWRHMAKTYWGIWARTKDDDYLTKMMTACDRAASLATVEQSNVFAEVMFIKARGFYAKQRYVEAEECLAAALKEHPNYLDAILFRGYVCADSQNLPAAQYWLRYYLIEQERLMNLQRSPLIPLEYANEVPKVYETLAALSRYRDQTGFNLGVLTAPALR